MTENLLRPDFPEHFEGASRKVESSLEAFIPLELTNTTKPDLSVIDAIDASLLARLPAANRLQVLLNSALTAAHILPDLDAMRVESNTETPSDRNALRDCMLLTLTVETRKKEAIELLHDPNIGMYTRLGVTDAVELLMDETEQFDSVSALTAIRYARKRFDHYDDEAGRPAERIIRAMLLLEANDESKEA